MSSTKEERAELLQKIKELLATYDGRHMVVLWGEDGNGALASISSPLGQMAQVVGRAFASAIVKAAKDNQLTLEEVDQMAATIHGSFGAHMIGLASQSAKAQEDELTSTPLSWGFTTGGEGNA
jgi:hypothetical protein